MSKRLIALGWGALFLGTISCSEGAPTSAETATTVAVAAAATDAPATCGEVENSGGVCKGSTPRKVRCARGRSARPDGCVSTGELTPAAYKTYCCP